MSTLAHAQCVRLADLASYQPEAIVSRQIAQAASGHVTLFAFDAGQGLSEHTAPFDALVHVLEGTAQVTVAGQTVSVGVGEAILLPAHQPHALMANERFKMVLTMLRA